MSKQRRKCSIATQSFAQNNKFIYSVKSKHLKLSDSNKIKEFKNDSLSKCRVSELTEGLGNDLMLG